MPIIVFRREDGTEAQAMVPETAAEYLQQLAKGNVALRAEVDRLILENGKLRAVASSGAALIRSLQATIEVLSDHEYPIRISRREFMDLPLCTRRKIMERQTDEFIAQMQPQIEAAGAAERQRLRDEEFDEDYS